MNKAAEQTTARVLTEDILTLKQAREEIHQATGRRPDLATVTRWVHRGCHGTKLDAVRIGRQLLTSRQALTRFIVARTEADV